MLPKYIVHRHLAHARFTVIEPVLTAYKQELLPEDCTARGFRYQQTCAGVAGRLTGSPAQAGAPTLRIL